MNKEANEIFPRALMLAARTFAQKPKVVGEILVALCGVDGATPSKTFTELQAYIFNECLDEIAELRAARAEKRRLWAERKRCQRANQSK